MSEWTLADSAAADQYLAYLRDQLLLAEKVRLWASNWH